MTRLLGRALALAFGLAMLALVIGCEDEKPTKPKIQARDTIGKTTQDVRELKAELAKGGVVTDGKTHSTGYLDLQADVYRTEVGNIGKMRVKMDMDMYEATQRREAQDLRRVHGSDHQEGQGGWHPASDAAVLPGIRLRRRQERARRGRVPRKKEGDARTD